MKKYSLSFDSVQRYAKTLGVEVKQQDSRFIVVLPNKEETFSDLRSVVKYLNERLKMAQKLSYIF